MANPSKTASLLADKSDNPMIAGQQDLVADASVAYTTGDLDAEAEIIAAVNATNGTINSILDILEAHGLMADA